MVGDPQEDMMKEFLRFYIVTTTTSETTWAEIREFIEDVENIRKDNRGSNSGFQYTHLDIFSDTETKDVIQQVNKQKYYKQKPRNFGKKVDHKFFLSENIREKLLSYKIVDFVIILKLKGSFIDFKQLIPFFLIHEKFPNTSMGIDFNGIEVKKTRYHMIFSIGQFLWNWKTAASLHAEHLVYSIHEEEIKDKPGKTRKIEMGKLPTRDDIVLRRFSPLIEINESIFDELFVNTLSKTVASVEPESTDKNPIMHLKADNFPIEKEKVDIKNLFVKRYIDFRAKANPPAELEDLLFNNFKNEPFIAFYLFIMVLDQLMLERAGTKSRPMWRKAIVELYEEKKILNYIVLIRRYATGLREVAENIIFHTPQKKGYFYFVLKKSAEYSPDLESQTDVLIEEKRFKDLYMKRYKKRMENLPDRFLEVVLLDMSEVGIIQSYRTRLQAKQKKGGAGDMEEVKLEIPNLEDFYVGKFSRLSGLSHLDMRYLAQLGLKTFAAIIKNKRGYFEVETNSESDKRRLIYFRNIKGIRPDRGKWFDYDLQNSIGDGTHYDILLPVSEVLIQDEEVAGTTYEVKSFIELFERWIHSPDEKEPLITDFSDFEDFSVGAYPKKDEYVTKIGEKIVAHYQKNKGSSALSVDFEQVRKKSIDFSTCIKILSYAQLSKNIDHIIIYNLDKDSFEQMKSQLRILAGFEKFWNNHSWLYLYDENGVPFIINGEDAAACDRLNKMVELHYGYCYTILEESREAAPVQTGEYKILPYELLINTYRNKIPVSLFEKNVYCILEKEIEGDELGLKIENAHMRLGSKIHLENFYEAEVFFHNNFYVERFAYLAARDILKRRRDNNRVFLVGYGNYSEMFLNRTKHILNYEAQTRKHPGEFDICPAYFICNDVDELKWQGLERLKDLNIGEEFYFALLVPVASSLTTNYKIIKSFKNEIWKIAKRNDFFEDVKLIFNAAIILIRDRIEEKPTDKERSYNWLEIDKVEKTVKTKNFNTPIKFYVCEEGVWNRPINCSRCFPDLYGDKKITDEEILLETNKASINPKLILGWPKVDEINFEDEKVRVERFKDYIKYDHIERSSNHHLYYIDTLKFFENQDNKHDVRQWLEEIKDVILGDSDAYNIIVSILHHSNTGFINLVNDTIFNGAATIIILDLDQEFRDNVITKYSYLKGLKGKIRFHFVDDSILTGQHYIMARSFVSSIFDEFRDHKERKYNVEIFTSIIVLLNRLSVYRKKDLSQPRSRIKRPESNQYSSHIGQTIFESYVTLFIPPIRDPESFCFICKYKEECKKLSQYSVLDKLKSHFNVIVKDLEEKNEFQVDYAESRIYNRLLLTHQIYHRLSRVKEDKEYKDEIEKIWNMNENIEFKINVIKVLSSPLLSYYKNIEKIVFKKLVTELDRLLDKTYDEIAVIDFNLMLTLMKQLTQLKSGFLLREKNIERIWHFYANYKKKFNNLYNGLYEAVRPPEYLRLVAEILKCEKKLKEKKTGPVLENDYLVIQRKISEAEEKIKNIPNKDVSDDGIGKVKQDLKNLVDELGIGDPHLVAKTISNLAEFKFSYVIMIKMLVYTDEAKSLWLEYLFRTGKELPKNFNESQSIPVNEPYNDLQRKFNFDKGISDIINQDYKKFYVLVKMENVTIMQRALYRFANESFQKEVESKIRSNEFRIDNLDVDSEFGVFLEKITSEYYYEYLRKFAPTFNRDAYRKIFNLYLLQTYLRLLESSEVPTNLTIEEEFNEITKLLTGIMEADMGFFTIRKFRTNEKELYTIGRSDTGRREVPFEVTPDYFTYKSVNNEEEWYSFFAPPVDEWRGLEKEKKYGQAIIVIRFFHSPTLKEGELKPTGGITFLYKDKYDENKRAQIKENIRYIMLIKEGIQTLLEKNFDNDNFNAWIESKKKDMFSTEYFRKFHHGAYEDIQTLSRNINHSRHKNLPIEERIKAMDYAFANSWIVHAQVTIGHLYSKYTMGKLKDEIDTSQGPFDISKNIFDQEFRDVLRMIGDQGMFKVEYQLQPGLKTSIWKDHLRFFIIEILLNYKKFKFDYHKGKIIIGKDCHNRLFIETHGTDTKQKPLEQIKKNLDSIRPVSSGIGLFTINKCINEYCGKNIDVDTYEDIFKTIIPIYQEVPDE